MSEGGTWCLGSSGATGLSPAKSFSQSSTSSSSEAARARTSSRLPTSPPLFIPSHPPPRGAPPPKGSANCAQRQPHAEAEPTDAWAIDGDDLAAVVTIAPQVGRRAGFHVASTWRALKRHAPP